MVGSLVSFTPGRKRTKTNNNNNNNKDQQKQQQQEQHHPHHKKKSTTTATTTATSTTKGGGKKRKQTPRPFLGGKEEGEGQKGRQGRPMTSKTPDLLGISAESGVGTGVITLRYFVDKEESVALEAFERFYLIFDPKSVCTPVSDLKDEKLLSKLMKWGLNRVETSSRCMEALFNLWMILARNEANRPYMLALGGSSLIWRACRIHHDVPGVQESAFRALSNIACNRDTKRSLMEEGAAEVIYTAMRRYPDDKLLQQEACWCLGNLAVLSENQLKLARTGCVDLVVNAMTTHKNCISLQKQGCRAISNLACHEENAEILEEGGACEVVALCLSQRTDEENFEGFARFEKHEEEEEEENGSDNKNTNTKGNKEGVALALIEEEAGELQEAACSAIWSMACHQSLRSRLITLDSWNLCINALLNNLTNQSVCQRACGSLANLIVGISTSITDKRVIEGSWYVFAAGIRHQGNPSVQSQVKRALWCIWRTYSSGDKVATSLRPSQDGVTPTLQVLCARKLRTMRRSTQSSTRKQYRKSCQRLHSSLVNWVEEEQWPACLACSTALYNEKGGGGVWVAWPHDLGANRIAGVHSKLCSTACAKKHFEFTSTIRANDGIGTYYNIKA